MSHTSQYLIERRRHDVVAHGEDKIPGPLPMRRESDGVRARLQRWMELAEKALNSPSPDNGDSPQAFRPMTLHREGNGSEPNQH
jgi:hypothetical protein